MAVPGVPFPQLILIKPARFTAASVMVAHCDTAKASRFHRTRVLMRMLRWLILAAVAILPALPAAAQRYDPNYPVCMQVWTRDGNTMNCRFTSWDQCRAMASGYSAMCFDNPYWSQPRPAPRGRRRRAS
jgi:hypothetical protein